MLISLIIPAFNCSTTLEAAVLSCQGIDGEVIIVNDGSNDNTEDVILALCEKYSFVRSITISNRGPAGARNEGIKIALGKYIMFLDSDDAFTPLAFDEINAALSKDLDLLIFGFRQCFLTSARDMEYIPNGKFSIDEFYKNNLLNQVWNKAYRRQFIIDNNIEFRPYKYGEDRLFNADVLSFTPRVVTIEKVLYNYMIDKSISLISGYNEHKFEACVEIHKSFSSLCKDKTVLSFMLLKNVLSCMTVLFADNCHLSKGEKKSKIKAILQNDDILDDIDLSQMSLPYKIIGKILKSKSIGLNYAFAFFVAFVQKRMLPLFLKFRK